MVARIRLLPTVLLQTVMVVTLIVIPNQMKLTTLTTLMPSWRLCKGASMRFTSKS